MNIYIADNSCGVACCDPCCNSCCCDPCCPVSGPTGATGATGTAETITIRYTETDDPGEWASVTDVTGDQIMYWNL